MGRQSGRALAIAVLLGALLLTLAILQYRWAGQVAAAERERMQATLRARADDFGRDFDRELTRAYAWLQVEPLQPGTTPDIESTARLRRWFEQAPHAGMVSAVFDVRRAGDGTLQLVEYDRDHDRFVEREWPPSLLPLRTRLEGDSRRPSAAPWRAAVPPVLNEVPALFIPHPLFRVFHADEGSVRIPLDAATGALVAVLDVAYLRQTLLPALQRSYFPSDGDFAFDLTLIDRATSDIVYATTPAAGLPSAPDAEVGLFAVRFEEFNRFLVQTRLERRESATGGGPAPEATTEPAPSLTGPDWRAPGPPPGGVSGFVRRGEAPRGQDRLSTLVLAGRAAEREPGAWRLLLTHRAGSLEAAVASTRRGHLALSFGVLALLAASIGLVLVSSRQAERLARQQVEFVAGVSHELRTPLAVIRSAGENLADGVVSDPAQVRTYGALVAREGRRLTDMVEQVMEFAGLEGGRLPRDRSIVRVGALVERAVASASEALTDAGVEVEVRVDQGVPDVVGDPEALARAVDNLLANATKYAPSGGWVGVAVSRAGTPGRPEVAVEVADRGPGIPPDEQRRLFEPFFRGAQALAAQVHGNGLGLSLVQRIVDAHGGRVAVRSEVSHGSAFTIYLPAASTRRVGPEASTDPTPRDGVTVQ